MIEKSPLESLLNCKACRLAKAMKYCLKCRFNDGIFEALTQAKTLEIPVNLTAQRTRFIQKIQQMNEESS